MERQNGQKPVIQITKLTHDFGDGIMMIGYTIWFKDPRQERVFQDTFIGTVMFDGPVQVNAPLHRPFLFTLERDLSPTSALTTYELYLKFPRFALPLTEHEEPRNELVIQIGPAGPWAALYSL